jgi:hypothetical protein
LTRRSPATARIVDFDSSTAMALLFDEERLPPGFLWDANGEFFHSMNA